MAATIPELTKVWPAVTKVSERLPPAKLPPLEIHPHVKMFQKICSKYWKCNLGPEAVAAGAYEFLTVARMPRIEEIAKKLLQLNNIPYKSVEAEDGWKSILVRLNNKLGMLCNQDELDNDNPVKVELSICNLVNLDSVKKREATGQAIDYRTLTDVQK